MSRNHDAPKSDPWPTNDHSHPNETFLDLAGSPLRLRYRRWIGVARSATTRTILGPVVRHGLANSWSSSSIDPATANTIVTFTSEIDRHLEPRNAPSTAPGHLILLTAKVVDLLSANQAKPGRHMVFDMLVELLNRPGVSGLLAGQPATPTPAMDAHPARGRPEPVVGYAIIDLVACHIEPSPLVIPAGIPIRHWVATGLGWATTHGWDQDGQRGPANPDVFDITDAVAELTALEHDLLAAFLGLISLSFESMAPVPQLVTPPQWIPPLKD